MSGRLILVVEDEPTVASALEGLLLAEGYRVRLAATCAQAASAFSKEVDLVLLDWMLPDGQGVDLLRRWRQTSSVPVIFVTARVDVVDRVVGLELGADDYVTKPFAPRELIARIQARLRQPLDVPSPEDDKPLEHLGVSMHLSTREVRFEGALIEMTKMEFDLLRVFLERPGRVFTREEILNRVWGYDRMPTTRTVDTHVLQLRQKLAADRFESVRGVGYRMRS